MPTFGFIVNEGCYMFNIENVSAVFVANILNFHATILPRQLPLLVHIVACLRSIIVFIITISSIHISKPSTCRSFTTVYRDAYVRDVTRAASVSERAFRRMKMYN